MAEEYDLSRWGNHLLKRLQKAKNPNMHYYYMFLQGLVNRTMRNEDAVVAVTGDRGKGKTNFSFASSMIIGGMLPKDRGPPFTWENVSYRYEDIGDIVERAGDLDQRVYTIDEAIDVARSSDAMTRANKELGKFMQKARKKRNIYFWNIPYFTELQSSIRNNVIHFWIHVFHKVVNEKREREYSVAALYTKDLNPFNRDKWGFDSVKASEPAIFDTPDLMEVLSKKKGFITFISCPRIPEVIEKKYEINSFDALRKAGAKFKESMNPSKPKPTPVPEVLKAVEA